MAEARRLHWATADTVLIEGATGSTSGIINGAFEVAERPDNGAPIYQRADGSDGWLYVSSFGWWVVGDEQAKNTRETSARCSAHSVEMAEGRLPEEVGAAWQVDDGQEFTEQRLRVLHGEAAKVAIAEVCVFAGLHAYTHTTAGTLVFSRCSAQLMTAQSIAGDL